MKNNTIIENISQKNYLELALKISLETHADKKDLGGNPYILHPLRIMNKFEDEEHQIVALLHDVIEDGNVTIEYLINKGFNQNIIDAIKCLTRGAEIYDIYIKKIAHNNKIARDVKIEDLKDNLNSARLNEVTEIDRKRINKYIRSLKILSEKNT